MPDDTPTAEYRDLLQEERTDLVSKLAELGAGGVGLTYDSNFADSSQVTAERSEAEALVASLQDTLEEVERAIGKLDQGTYGQCESCGRQIDPVRLEAKPAAALLHRLRIETLTRERGMAFEPPTGAEAAPGPEVADGHRRRRDRRHRPRPPEEASPN